MNNDAERATAPGAMPDLADLTATEAMRRMRAGRLTPEALMAACLERIAAREGTVRAFASLNPEAALAPGTMPSSAAEGPLHGLPIGVKDILDTSDLPTEYGSPIWRRWQPHADAASVAWARAAGAVVIGKTVTTEFANAHPGPTTNPHDPRRTPGGSSSGSAAGVAAGFFPLAFGTQTAGSVIRPAAFCGVVGYKPSYGMINRAGMKLMSDSLDTIGVLARSVADCALFAGAVAGRDLGDPDVRPGRAPRVGICRSPGWHRAQPETHELLEQVASRVAAAGATVEMRELPALFSGLVEAHPVVMLAESARSLGFELRTAAGQISDTLMERLKFGRAQSAEALQRALDTFEQTRLAFPGALEDLDFLLTPSAPGVAPEGLGSTGDPVFNFIWTSLHVPCVTVPAGEGPGRLPLGIQIVTPRGEDRAALAWAAWVAAALNS
jgi:Asp-tRNA(Asn)/Glu-tRNA(Gln) amidotransferase A subunit family amidase